MRDFVAAVDRLSVLCAVIAAVMLAIAAVVICWNVIYRATGASTYWEIEFSVYMMVASLFLASPYCLKTKGHVAVDLLSHYLPARASRVTAVVVLVIGFVVCVYLAIAGGMLTWEAFERGDRTESTWAPLKWPLFLTMPVGLALTALQYAAELVRPLAQRVEL
jgi:TRAP-type C4-dicarboxylate transport system permease small subunit